MKDYEEFPPIVVDRGEGSWLVDMEGNRYLDAISSWWSISSVTPIPGSPSSTEQAERLEHCIFCNFSHPKAIELAEGITRLAPEGLEKVFLRINGSSAVEIAPENELSIPPAAKEHKEKTLSLPLRRIPWRNPGSSFGERLDLYGKIYAPLLFESLKAPAPYCFRCVYGENRETCEAPCFEHLESLVAQRGEEICGIILEPLVQGAAGMRMYSPAYLKKLRDLCSRENIHFIADEIAVGFGRTGTMFACEQAQVSPDMMCLSKGITSGYLPLSLVLTTEEIYRAFYGEYTELKAFMDSHSYTGNALACETLKIFEEEKIILKNRDSSRFIKELTEPLAQARPFVGEFRQLGMIAALELVDPKSGKSFPWQARTGYHIYRRALQKGLLLRPLGNVLYFMPPYCTSQEDLALMVQGAFQTLDEYFRPL